MSHLLPENFREEHRSSQHGSIQKLSFLIIVACCFIMLVSILAWFALDRVKERIQADVSDGLQIVLHTTQESLNLWVESNKLQLTRLAEDPRLIFLAGRLLSVPRNKKALLKSQTLQELRDFLQYGRDPFGQARFLVISPDFINIGSMRDHNVGAKNLIANQALDLLNRTFKGQTVMVPPIWSDIPLITSLDGKNEKSPAMFFAAPIKDLQERVIAVIAQRVDPAIDFTRLIQLGRIGKSGDTYAFGQYGKLLSESRFDQDLRKAGLIREGETSILTVSVRDPGGDMTQGFIPSVPRYQQPLTLMARQATMGKSGLNVEGYRDYRGVRVHGAWLWDDKLGIGLTTEIDEADALSPYFTTRAVILTVLGITVLLALGSLVFAMLIDVRASRALQKSHDDLENRVAERTAELKQKQESLEQAEERSRLLLESAEEGIFGVAENGLVNFINPAGLALLGFETDELIGQKIHPLIHHSRHDGTPYPIEECPMYQSLTHGVSDSRDDEVLWRKDGTSFPVEYTSVPIRKDGSITGTVVVFRDISERKQAEEALRESEINMRTIFENSPLGMIHFRKDGTILDCNDKFVELMGSSREKLIGFNTPKETNDEKLRVAIINALAGETAEYEGDYTSVTGNKTTSLRVVFNPTESGKSPTEVIATLEDITERKQAEEAIRESRERLNTILKTTAQGFWLNDQDDNIMEVNEAMCEILSLGKDEIVGSNFFDFLDEKNKEIVREQNRMRKKGIHSLYEISLIRADGQQVPCLMNASPLLDKDGNVVGSFGMTTNIAERKQMEEELRKNVDELERFSKVAFGREKKMIQLKQEINELMSQLRQGEKYKIVK